MLLFIPFALVSCAVSQQQTPFFPSQSTDRADLVFETEGVTYDGVALVERRTSRKFRVTPPKDTAEMIVTTCHRETFHVAKTPWEFTYQPAMWLENWDSCLLSFTAVGKAGVNHTALVDFTSNETLPAKVNCNGERLDYPRGASLCQSRAGLVQLISFDVPVQVKWPARCAAPYTERGVTKDWRWYVELSKGLCVYSFKSDDDKYHRFTTRGYVGR